MLTGVEETAESFIVPTADGYEPMTIAKALLEGSEEGRRYAEELRRMAVPQSAPGHFDGVLAAAVPDDQMFSDPEAPPNTSTAADAPPPLYEEANLPMLPGMSAEPPPFPMGAPNPIPSFGAALQEGLGAANALPVAPAGLAPMDLREPPPLAPEFTQRGPRELSMQRVKGMAPTAPAPTETQSAETTKGGSVAGRFAYSQRGGGGGGEFKPEEFKPDAEKAKIDQRLAENAVMQGEIAGRSLEDQARIREESERRRLEIAADFDRRIAERDAETKALMDEVRDGKVDPNRLWASMDGARRTQTMIGLILGGIGGVFSGRNMVMEALDREIARDVALQSESIDRKKSLVQEYRNLGLDMREARERAMADIKYALAAQIDTRAALSGSELARAKGAEAADQLRLSARNADVQAAERFRDAQFKELDITSMAKLRASQAQLARMETAIKQLEYDRLKSGQPQVDPKIAALEHTLPNGQVVIASDPESKGRIAKAQSEHETFVRGLQMLKTLRAQNPGGNITPAFLSFLGLSSAEQTKYANDLTGAIRLAYLKAQGAGAYDKGSGELSKEIIQSPTDWFSGSDKAYNAHLDRLMELANQDFLSTVTGNTRGGRVYAAPSGFSVVGKAD